MGINRHDGTGRVMTDIGSRVFLLMEIYGVGMVFVWVCDITELAT